MWFLLAITFCGDTAATQQQQRCNNTATKSKGRMRCLLAMTICGDTAATQQQHCNNAATTLQQT